VFSRLLFKLSITNYGNYQFSHPPLFCLKKPSNNLQMASSQNESRIAPGQVFLQRCQNQRCVRTATAAPSAMGLDLESCGCWRSGDLKVLFGMLVKTVSMLYIHKVGPLRLVNRSVQ